MTSDMNHIEIARRIKEVRLSRGLTQQAFASKLGIVQGVLSDVERGKKYPSDTLLIALCHLYEINEEWLLTGNGEVSRKVILQEGDRPHRRVEDGPSQEGSAGVSRRYHR